MRDVTNGRHPRRPIDLEHLLSQWVSSTAVATERVDTVHVQPSARLASGSKLLTESRVGGRGDKERPRCGCGGEYPRGSRKDDRDRTAAPEQERSTPPRVEHQDQRDDSGSRTTSAPNAWSCGTKSA